MDVLKLDDWNYTDEKNRFSRNMDVLKPPKKPVMLLIRAAFSRNMDVLKRGSKLDNIYNDITLAVTWMYWNTAGGRPAGIN